MVNVKSASLILKGAFSQPKNTFVFKNDFEGTDNGQRLGVLVNNSVETSKDVMQLTTTDDVKGKAKGLKEKSWSSKHSIEEVFI